MSYKAISPIIQSLTKSSMKKMVIIRSFLDRITRKDALEFDQQVHSMLDRFASEYLSKITGRNLFGKAEKEVPHACVKSPFEERFIEQNRYNSFKISRNQPFFALVM